MDSAIQLSVSILESVWLNLGCSAISCWDWFWETLGGDVTTALFLYVAYQFNLFKGIKYLFDLSYSNFFEKKVLIPMCHGSEPKLGWLFLLFEKMVKGSLEVRIHGRNFFRHYDRIRTIMHEVEGLNVKARKPMIRRTQPDVAMLQQELKQFKESRYFRSFKTKEMKELGKQLHIASSAILHLIDPSSPNNGEAECMVDKLIFEPAYAYISDFNHDGIEAGSDCKRKTEKTLTLYERMRHLDQSATTAAFRRLAGHAQGYDEKDKGKLDIAQEIEEKKISVRQAAVNANIDLSSFEINGPFAFKKSKYI